MLIRFLNQWGNYCASDDVHKCYLMVVKEKTIFLDQVKERKSEVNEILCHHEWVEREKPLFPQGSFYQNHWIPKVEAFVRKWTSAYVPKYVKKALAEVKERYPTN